jgi:hypothetical protein
LSQYMGGRLISPHHSAPISHVRVRLPAGRAPIPSQPGLVLGFFWEGAAAWVYGEWGGGSVDEKAKRRWRDIEELVDWVEGNLRDLRREMAHARSLSEQPGAPREPPVENLKRAIVALEEAKEQTVHAINSVSARSRG